MQDPMTSLGLSVSVSIVLLSTGPNEHQNYRLHANRWTDLPTQPGYSGTTVLLRAAPYETMVWLPFGEKQHRIRIGTGFGAKSARASIMVGASKTQNPKRRS